MFVSKQRWRFCRSSLLPTIAVLASGCSGKLEYHEPEIETGGSASLFTGGTGGLGASGGRGSAPSVGGADIGGIGGDEPYIEPDCPDEPPPPVVQECDPLEPFKDCENGFGCYPFLSYPESEDCGFTTFGTICAPASTGEQGEFCGDGVGYCAPGYMCVVGATAGKRCGKVCTPGSGDTCKNGLICGDTDVKGFGVCF